VRTTLFRKFILASMTGIFFAGYAALSLAGTQAAKQEAMASQIAVQTENTLVGNIKSDGLRQAEIPEIIRLAQMDNAGTISDLASITKLSVQQDGEETVVEIHGSEDLEYTAFKLLKPLRLVMDFPGVSRGKFNEKIEVNNDLVNHINPLYFSEAQVLRVEIVLNHTASYDIQKISQNQLEVRFKPVSVQAQAPQQTRETVSAAEPSSPAQSPYSTSASDVTLVDSCAHLLSGEKDRISLDFQNVEVIDILRIIADISGYNIVLSKGSFGLTNIKLKDIPWNKVLEIILKNNSLGRECDGNIIRIASQAALAAGQEEGLLVTEIIRLNYADLNDMKANLAGILSVRGSINSNQHTNTLIITDVQQNVDDMKGVIKALDTPTKQVTIASRIVEVSSETVDELGISWGVTHASTHPENFPANFFLTGQSNRFGDPTDPIGLPRFMVDLPITQRPAGSLGLSFGNLAGNTILDVQLQALERRGLTRIITNPKITTLDNVEASISKGTKIPFQTFSNTSGTEVEFLDAEVDLTVTPHITPDDRVYMKIRVLKNSIGPDVSGFPSINTSEAFTEVLVDNGSTTVIGGLYIDDTSDASDRVPFLADIPFLGVLFRNTLKSRDLDELLIFITPTIVRELDI